MEKCTRRAAASLVLALAAGGVLAQVEQPTATLAPQPAAGTGETASAFAGYRPYRADEPLTDWRAANDLVARAGGHLGHGQAAPDAARPDLPVEQHPMEHGR